MKNYEEIYRKNKDVVDEMFQSVEDGDINKLAKLLSTNLELIDTPWMGWAGTLLHYAVRYDRKEIALYLLEQGLDVNVLSSHLLSTALEECCGKFREEKGNLDLAKMLLAKGACVDGVAISVSTPLIDAAKNGESKIVELLLEHGADINRLHRQFNRTALDLAKGWSGDATTIDLLTAKGALSAYEVINPSTERAGGILAYIYEEVGPILSCKLSRNSIDIRVVPIEKKNKLKLLFTIGAFPQLPRMEFLICVPFNWPVNKQLMEENSKYSFPMELLFQLAEQRLAGVEISEGYSINKHDEKWGHLEWPENVDAFILVDYEFPHGSDATNASEIVDENTVSLLLLVPYKFPKSGPLKGKKLKEWLEKRRTAGWVRNTLKLEHFQDFSL